MALENRTEIQKRIESIVTNGIGYDSSRPRGFLFFRLNEETDIQTYASIRGFEDDFELQIHLGKLDSIARSALIDGRDYFSLKNMYRDLSRVGLLPYLNYGLPETLTKLLSPYREWRKRTDWELAEYTGRVPSNLDISHSYCSEGLLLDIKRRGAIALFQSHRGITDKGAYIPDYFQGKDLHTHSRGAKWNLIILKIF